VKNCPLCKVPHKFQCPKEVIIMRNIEKGKK